MSKVRIFVSSTCFDLAAVREDLRGHIIALGHEPLLSEYPSFPVSPDDDAITNCRKNVRSHSDILVLIVAGRRGHLDAASGKSVTNLEYETARQAGIPCFVFIQKSVAALLSVWAKNPTVDFTPTVDLPEVFTFIERLWGENRWAFTFDKTGEIKETLTVQLSVMLRELMDRKRTGALDHLPGFASESAEIRELVRDKPRYWEFLLTSQMLSSRLVAVRKRFEGVQSGRIHTPTRKVTTKEFIDLAASRVHDLELLAGAMQAQVKEIHGAWGLPGEPGDPTAIKTAVDELVDLCGHLISWEQDLRSIQPPEPMMLLKSTMKGWTELMLAEMERLADLIVEPFKDGNEPSGTLYIDLVLASPPVEAFCAEMERLAAQPWLLVE